MIYCL